MLHFTSSGGAVLHKKSSSSRNMHKIFLKHYCFLSILKFLDFSSIIMARSPRSEDQLNEIWNIVEAIVATFKNAAFLNAVKPGKNIVISKNMVA